MEEMSNVGQEYRNFEGGADDDNDDTDSDTDGGGGGSAAAAAWWWSWWSSQSKGLFGPDLLSSQWELQFFPTQYEIHGWNLVHSWRLSHAQVEINILELRSKTSDRPPAQCNRVMLP